MVQALTSSIATRYIPPVSGIPTVPWRIRATWKCRWVGGLSTRAAVVNMAEKSLRLAESARTSDTRRSRRRAARRPGRFDAAAAPWREALEDLDEDVLAEAGAEARPSAAAVDELVRGLLGQLADWQQPIGELGRALTTANEGRPLPGWSTDAGRTEDIGWRLARTTLLEAVARHHQAHLLAVIVELGGELELPATRNGRFRGAFIPEGCAVSAGRRPCGGRRPVRSAGRTRGQAGSTSEPRHSGPGTPSG